MTLGPLFFLTIQQVFAMKHFFSRPSGWRILFASLIFSLLAFPALAAGGEGAAPSLTVRMSTLVIQLGVVWFAARLCNMLFEKIRLPGVLGELCAGILIGPYLLGGLALPFLGFDHGLFALHPAVIVGDTPVSPELYGLCTVASIILLFLVGIETDLQMFMRYSVAGTLVGLGGVVASFLTGDLLGVWLLPSVLPGQTFDFFHPACIFLGVMSTATSVSITARILSERRKIDSPEGVTTLAGAVIDDVLGIIMLAIGGGLVVAGKSQSGAVDWAAIGDIAAKAISIWLGATLFGIVVSRRVSRGLKHLGGETEIAVAALGLALIVGGLFEEAHLAMIIGAYVVGLALSRADISHMIREKLQPVYAFMVPVFFAVMGMMVNIKMLLDPKILVFGLVYTAVAVLAKVLGCGLPALLCAFNLRGALRVGIGMVPRGEVALIVAGIGKTQGYLSDEVFGIAVMMTLLTTLLAPPLLVGVYRNAKSGVSTRRLKDEAARAAEEAQPIVYSFGNADMISLVLEGFLAEARKEGYFTHTLNREEGLYQARKDDRVISIACTPKSITFHAPRDLSAEIKSCVMEVVARYEQFLRDLRTFIQNGRAQFEISPVDLEVLRKRELVVNQLPAAHIIPSLLAGDKTAAIIELVDLLCAGGGVADRDAALNGVLDREQAMATGIGHGIATPHARTDAVHKMVCALGVSRGGVDFGGGEGKPAHLILLTLFPASQNGPYMSFLASALATLNDTQLAVALRKADSSEAIHTAIARAVR
jgi:Kef-type K+ transport system membrane component KefB/mannitol/fructose-specific phosphotransferase system IIA component (Ntr-type)